VQLCIF